MPGALSAGPAQKGRGHGSVHPTRVQHPFKSPNRSLFSYSGFISIKSA